MLVGILSDTHDELDRTRDAVRILRDAGAEVLIHCGDLSGPEIVEICSTLPFYFVFGNWDADNTPALRKAAKEHGATCLGWGGVVDLFGKRIGVVHGHMRSDLRKVLEQSPDYLLSGHSHIASDQLAGSVRRINPGALHEAERFTVALLNLAKDEVVYHEV